MIGSLAFDDVHPHYSEWLFWSSMHLNLYKSALFYLDRYEYKKNIAVSYLGVKKIKSVQCAQVGKAYREWQPLPDGHPSTSQY